MDRKIGKRIMYLSRHHQAYINHLLKDSDFTYAQFNILRILKDHDGISQDALANKLFVDKARISRVIQQLEEKGLIHKQNAKADKRQFCIYMSDKGKESWPNIHTILKTSGDLMLDGLTDEEITMALSLLDKMCKNVSKGEFKDE